MCTDLSYKVIRNVELKLFLLTFLLFFSTREKEEEKTKKGLKNK